MRPGDRGKMGGNGVAKSVLHSIESSMSGFSKVRRVALSAPPQRQSGVKIQEKEAAEAVRRAMELMAGQKLI